MNIRTSAFRGLAILSLTALGMAACDGKDTINIPEPTPPPVEVTVAPTQVSIPVGGTATAAAVVKNSTNQSVTWSSGNGAVATVTAAGVITGVAVGSTVITATSAADATAKGLVAVTVTAPVITLSVLPTTATLNSVAPGNTIQLAATVSGSTNQTVTWATSASGVATVVNGLVTAVAPGTAVITATAAADANVKTSSVITVVAPVSNVSITLQPATANTTIGGTVQMVAIVSGSTNAAVTYASSDPLVATVSATGLVTGVKGGTAVITATAAADNTKKATAVITVAGAAPVASISIASVVDHGTAEPVNPASISDQIDVTVNVSAVPENGVMAVAVYVDDKQVCRQNFTNPLGTTQGVATINCPVNTAEYDAATFVPKFLNGTHTISAKALKVDDGVITVATFCPVGGNCAVTFDNSDFIAEILTSFEKTVGDWHAGIITATIHFVQYTTPSVASLAAKLDESCDGEDVVDFTAAGSGAVYTGTVSEDDVTLTGACVRSGAVKSAEFQYDTEAPFVATAPNVSSNLYYNDLKTITAALNDSGVDTEDGNTIIEIRSGTTVVKTGAAGSSVTTEGLAETALNNGYQVWVYGKDALDNEAWYGPYGNFGIDFTEPTVTWQIIPATPGDTVNNTATNNQLTDIAFKATYIDVATPPAGPAGFNPNPVSCTNVFTNAAGTSTTSAAVNDTYTWLATAVNGYYVIDCKVTDAAGNFVTMPTFTRLIDNVQPSAGNLTVPSVLTGGAAYTLSAVVTDNLDLGTGWATIGYGLAGDSIGYWLVQNETTFGTYGLPLTTSTTFGTLTIPSIIRSVKVVDPATNLAGADLVHTAARAEYALRDVAGVVLKDVCPAATFNLLDGATSANCMLRIQDITAGYIAGNPTGATSAWTITGATPLDTLGNKGFMMDHTTGAIDAVITGPAQTFNNPFTQVYFYYIDSANRAHLIPGTVTIGVTDNTILQVRTWRYTIATAWASSYTKVFALVVNSSGDALVTQSEPHP